MEAKSPGKTLRDIEVRPCLGGWRQEEQKIANPPSSSKEKERCSVLIPLTGSFLQNAGKLSLRFFSFKSSKGSLFYDPKTCK